MSSPRRLRAGRYALMALPLCGLVELAAHLWLRESAPDLQDWAALREPVTEMRTEGQAILVAPRWAEPLARRSLGGELFPMQQLARADAERFDEAIEISVLGETASETRDWTEEQRIEVGDFTVRRLRNPVPRPILVDFVSRIPSAEVTFGQAAIRCVWNPRARVAAGGLGGHPTFPRARFECPGSVFFNVGVTAIADERFLPRRCIWAHPPAAGELRIRFADVDLGETIAGHSGMYWMIERARTGAPVQLAVRVEGEAIGSVVHRDGEGWQAFEVPLGAHAGRRGATVELAVSSPDFRHRHFCFEAVSR